MLKVSEALKFSISCDYLEENFQKWDSAVTSNQKSIYRNSVMATRWWNRKLVECAPISKEKKKCYFSVKKLSSNGEEVLGEKPRDSDPTFLPL